MPTPPAANYPASFSHLLAPRHDDDDDDFPSTPPHRLLTPARRRQCPQNIMQTRNSVLGKRSAPSDSSLASSLASSPCDIALPPTPEQTPTAKRIKHSSTQLDGDGNKENVPPFRIEAISGSPTTARVARSLRRSNTEQLSPSRTRSSELQLMLALRCMLRDCVAKLHGDMSPWRVSCRLHPQLRHFRCRWSLLLRRRTTRSSPFPLVCAHCSGRHVTMSGVWRGAAMSAT